MGAWAVDCVFKYLNNCFEGLHIFPSKTLHFNSQMHYLNPEFEDPVEH